MKECAAQAFEEGQKQTIADLSKAFADTIPKLPSGATNIGSFLKTLISMLPSFSLNYNPYKSTQK